MSATNINVSQVAFTSKQTPVVYRQFNVPTYLANGHLIAPSTDATLPLYSAGRILATYGADAPSPELVGMLVNWDHTSAVVSQTKPTHILSDEFTHDMAGVDTTTAETYTATCNRVPCTSLSIGLCLYANAITEGNTATVVTAFNAAYTVTVLGQSRNTLDVQNEINAKQNDPTPNRLDEVKWQTRDQSPESSNSYDHGIINLNIIISE